MYFSAEALIGGGKILRRANYYLQYDPTSSKISKVTNGVAEDWEPTMSELLATDWLY